MYILGAGVRFSWAPAFAFGAHCDVPFYGWVPHPTKGYVLALGLCRTLMYVYVQGKRRVHVSSSSGRSLGGWHLVATTTSPSCAVSKKDTEQMVVS